jgi:hypothetical protein
MEEVMVYMLRGVEIEREDVRAYKSKGKEKEGKEEVEVGKERRVGNETDQFPFNSHIYPILNKGVNGDKSSPVQS